MVPHLNPDKARRPSRRKVKGVVFLLYAFIVIVATGMGLSYRKILTDMTNLMESSASTPTINGKPIHPGFVGGLSVDFAKAAAAAAADAAGGRGVGGRPSQQPPETKQAPAATCAILLFGLPRAFKDFVLPSLERNVVRPNAKYGCDYFAHYYQQDSEASGRSGRGGSIRAEDIFLLNRSVATIFREANANVSTPPSPTVTFVSDTKETFWDKRGDVIQHYRTAKNADGNYSFYPYGERTYEYPGTLDNIVRQWHSVNAVWDAMEAASSKKGSSSSSDNNNHKKRHQYRRVAMLRNDVIYLTPIDIYSVPVVDDASKTKDGRSNPTTTDDYSTNTRSVIPNFAKYPVNDRLIYGPHSSVEVWASQRFSRIEEYARDPSATPGMVMHSETFLNASILQAIREAGPHDAAGGNSDEANANNNNSQPVLFEDPWMCFLRVRADGAIWIEDCDASKSGFGGGYPGGEASYTKLLRDFLPNHGKGCKRRRLKDKVRKIIELACPKTSV